jgi:hypothetical protein
MPWSRPAYYQCLVENGVVLKKGEDGQLRVDKGAVRAFYGSLVNWAAITAVGTEKFFGAGVVGTALM